MFHSFLYLTLLNLIDKLLCSTVVDIESHNVVYCDIYGILSQANKLDIS